MDIQHFDRPVRIARREIGNSKVHYRAYDIGTGELLIEWTETRRRGGPESPPKQAEHLRLYRYNWMDVVLEDRLTMYERGLFVSLLAFVNWQSNYLVHPKTGANLSEWELAVLLKVDRTALHGHLQALCDKGYVSIVKRGKGRPNHVLLNSHIGFRGKYIKDLAEHRVFENVEYKPVVPIQYKEPKPKSEA